jgi:hypothetical protein
MLAGGVLSPNPIIADASACCCKDKIEEKDGEEEEEEGTATRTKNIIVFMILTNIILESRAFLWYS